MRCYAFNGGNPMSSSKYDAIASIDKATDGVHSLILRINLTDAKAVELVDTTWYDALRELTAKYGGASINGRELRAGYNPSNSSHYDRVLKKLQEKFNFKNPR
jgi:hypothetical protein